MCVYFSVIPNSREAFHCVEPEPAVRLWAQLRGQREKDFSAERFGQEEPNSFCGYVRRGCEVKNAKDWTVLGVKSSTKKKRKSVYRCNGGCKVFHSPAKWDELADLEDPGRDVAVPGEPVACDY